MNFIEYEPALDEWQHRMAVQSLARQKVANDRRDARQRAAAAENRPWREEQAETEARMKASRA